MSSGFFSFGKSADFHSLLFQFLLPDSGKRALTFQNNLPARTTGHLAYVELIPATLNLQDRLASSNLLTSAKTYAHDSRARVASCHRLLKYTQW